MRHIDSNGVQPGMAALVDYFALCVLDTSEAFTKKQSSRPISLSLAL